MASAPSRRQILIAYLVIYAIGLTADLGSTRIALLRGGGSEANPLSPASAYGMLLVELLMLGVGLSTLYLALLRKRSFDESDPRNRTGIIYLKRFLFGSPRRVVPHFTLFMAIQLVAIKFFGATNNIVLLLIGKPCAYDVITGMLGGDATTKFWCFSVSSSIAYLAVIEAILYRNWKSSGRLFTLAEDEPLTEGPSHAPFALDSAAH